MSSRCHAQRDTLGIRQEWTPITKNVTTTLFTVESAFTIRGRGIVLLPGLSVEQYASVKVGDPLLIVCPGGSVIRTEVKGVEYPPSIKWIGERPANPRYGVLVSLNEVPAGSVVMSEQQSEGDTGTF